MNKETFLKEMRTAGDAVISYVSPNSHKEKFNVGTLDFGTPHISRKPQITKVESDRILIFCWDTDKFKQIDYRAVTKIQPLSQVVERSKGGRTYFRRSG